MTGQYKLIVDNAQGTAEKSLKLNMLTPPTPPQDVELKDLFESTFVLKWTAPKDDGGSPVVGYKIEIDNLSEKSSWYAYSPADNAQVQFEINDKIRKVLTDPDRYLLPNLNRYKCEGFRKNQIIRIRIRAANRVGESEPVPIGDRITMKNPWTVPNPPLNPKVSDWTETAITVQWSPPDSDGGSPVTAYVVEYKEKMASTWKSFVELDPKKLQAVLPDLRTGASYVCRIRARNREGDSEPSVQTAPQIAKARFVKPFFLDVATMQNITIRKGQMARWDVAYGGEPDPTSAWFKVKLVRGIATREEEVKETGEDARVTVESYERNTVLNVKKAERVDSGRFTVRVTNECGTVDHTADLLVLDKPTPPDGIPETTKVRADCATLAFKPPKDDGGCPILGYIIEKMDTETGRWVGAGECGPDKNEFEVKNIIKGKRYKLRVKAYNKEGESDPSEMETTFVAQNPYGKIIFFLVMFTEQNKILNNTFR